MNDSEIIANLARQIAELEQAIENYKSACRIIRNELFCIGGPLNDNKLGYSQKQLIPFRKIAEEIEYL